MTTLALCLLAGEIAILSNGFELTIDHHEVRGDNIVLISGSGETVLPRSQVMAIEALPDPPKPVPELTPTPKIEPPKDPIESAAAKHGLPLAFVRSVAKAESAFNPKAISHKGAIGLMQLMPDTAKSLGVDPYKADENAEGGARLLRDLLIQYQNEPDQVRRALAAYNAGEGTVKKYSGVPPYRETQTYIERVLRNYHQSSQTK